MNIKNNLFRKSGDGRRSFYRDERAVSAVIGVILMIAITVVVAAIIAGFAYGIGSPDVAPSTSLSIEGAEDGGNTFTIRHTGGDTIMKALDTDNDDYIETGATWK